MAPPSHTATVHVYIEMYIENVYTCRDSTENNDKSLTPHASQRYQHKNTSHCIMTAIQL